MKKTILFALIGLFGIPSLTQSAYAAENTRPLDPTHIEGLSKWVSRSEQLPISLSSRMDLYSGGAKKVFLQRDTHGKAVSEEQWKGLLDAFRYAEQAPLFLANGRLHVTTQVTLESRIPKEQHWHLSLSGPRTANRNHLSLALLSQLPNVGSILFVSEQVDLPPDPNQYMSTKILWQGYVKLTPQILLKLRELFPEFGQKAKQLPAGR